jgi:hypothetical protein
MKKLTVRRNQIPTKRSRSRDDERLSLLGVEDGTEHPECALSSVSSVEKKKGEQRRT